MDIPNEAFIMKSKKIIKFIPKSKLINYEPKLWNTKFTHIENIQKLQLTDVGVYSIATPIISDSMLKFIQEISTLYSLKSLNELNVLETHGGIGGFSTKIAQYCKNLKILEIDPLHVKIIKNNLDLYGISNYEVLNMDSLEYLLNSTDNLSGLNEIDLVVCDPPWGDLYYKHKNLKIGINNVNISFIINNIVDKVRVVILMAPKNFDLHNFIKDIKTNKIIIQKLHKHFLIAVVN